MARTLSKESVARMSQAAEHYRTAFDAVQALLRGQESGPRFVFAVDQLGAAEVDTLPDGLREAERHRRRTRAALHALVELVSLEDDGLTGPSGAPDPADHADLSKLDRFITVTNGARLHGCSYVNGTFEPTMSSNLPDPADTFDFPPRVDER
jgi:hypothetical protein